MRIVLFYILILALGFSCKSIESRSSKSKRVKFDIYGKGEDLNTSVEIWLGEDEAHLSLGAFSLCYYVSLIGVESPSIERVNIKPIDLSFVRSKYNELSHRNLPNSGGKKLTTAELNQLTQLRQVHSAIQYIDSNRNILRSLHDDGPERQSLETLYYVLKKDKKWSHLNELKELFVEAESCPLPPPN